MSSEPVTRSPGEGQRKSPWRKFSYLGAATRLTGHPIVFARAPTLEVPFHDVGPARSPVPPVVVVHSDDIALPPLGVGAARSPVPPVVVARSVLFHESE